MASDPINGDVAIIRRWMEKESYLPSDHFHDAFLLKFLHSCYYSLERTKECIDKFCTTRSHMNEVYIDRDVHAAPVRIAFSISKMANFTTADGSEVLIHRIEDPGLEKFNFYELLRAFSLLGDCWLQDSVFLAEQHVVIMDMNDYTLKVLSKVNLMFLKEFFLYLLEGVPVRLKQIHLVNCPTFMDKLFAVIKPMLPNDIVQLIHFHQNYDSLHKFIDKKYLPSDYDGDSRSLSDQHRDWLKKVEEKREFFLNNDLWKSDLKKRPKNAQNIMNGSFRTLDID